MQHVSFFRMGVMLFSVLGLALVYIFQNFDLASVLFVKNWPMNFILNRTIRFILNDFFVILLIYAIFNRKDYVVVALFVQLFGFIFILVPYLIIKINFPSHMGLFVSFLHRLVVNPLLLILLLPGFFLLQQEKT